MINNEAAYEAGKKRSIINNAKKTFDAANPVVAKWLTDGMLPNGQRKCDMGGDFMGKMLTSYETYGKLTERQATVVLTQINKTVGRMANWEKKREEVAQAEAQMTPLSECRQTFVGRIVGVKEVADKFSYMDGATITKVVVQSKEGYKVYITCPSKVSDGYQDVLTADASYDQFLKGLTIRFDVAITNSPDNNAFNFGKRPTKVTIVSSTTPANRK